MSIIALEIEAAMREFAARPWFWVQCPDGAWEQRRQLVWDDETINETGVNPVEADP